MKQLLKDLLTAYKYGLKTLYYHNTRDGADDTQTDLQDDGCAGGACKISTAKRHSIKPGGSIKLPAPPVFPISRHSNHGLLCFCQTQTISSKSRCFSASRSTWPVMISKSTTSSSG